MSRKIMFGGTLGAALFFMAVGVIFWGGFNTAMEATNTLGFCVSCHEMKETVFQEYKGTIHYANRSGVRATCSDCHVPDPWVHKFVRKVRASNELFHKVLGSINTPEKFENKRLQLAMNVWQSMKETDSRECRNCHDFNSMQPQDQKKRARQQHIMGMQAGNTCIDCHKGIAHKKVHDRLTEAELDELEQPLAANKRPIPPQWQAFIDEQKDAGKEDDKMIAAAQPEVERVLNAPLTSDSDTQAATSSTDNPAAGLDWSGITPTMITLFYPGQASMEWALTGSDHGGKRAFTKGDRCYDCHEEEEVDIGDLIVSGEKLETAPIPGKRGSIAVDVSAAYDANYLYMRFQWQDVEQHAPVPFVEGGKMDAENPMKLAVMLAAMSEGGSPVEYAERAGCWQTCHHDADYMPDQPDKAVLGNHPLAGRLDLSRGVTKYLNESRSAVEVEGKGGKKRGGWDKLKDEAAIQAALDNGVFMDLLRYQSGADISEDGYVLHERVMSGGQGVNFSGALQDGVWTVFMTRKLVSNKAGDISMSTDQIYNIGFAVHDDYSGGRFHHVSLGFRLGFNNEDAEINAIAR